MNAITKSKRVEGGVWMPIPPTMEAVLSNPDVFNPNKNSLGTSGFGLTKFDCTWQSNILFGEAKVSSFSSKIQVLTFFVQSDRGNPCYPDKILQNFLSN